MGDLRALTVYVVLVELIGLGVLFSFLVGGVASGGGVATLDLTRYGERWIEYLLMLVLTAVTPYALYLVDERHFRD